MQLLGYFALAELLVVIERDGHVDPLWFGPQSRRTHGLGGVDALLALPFLLVLVLRLEVLGLLSQ